MGLMNLRPLASLTLATLLSFAAHGQGWQCYGGNAQHSGQYTGASQSAGIIKWQTNLDDNRAYYGGEVFAHFAAPMVTPQNTVVYGYRSTTTVNGNSDYDNWSVIARSAVNGQPLWQFNTDYSAAILFTGNGGYWTTVYPLTLFRLNSTTSERGVAAGAAGGSILIRASADAANNTTKRLVFYTNVADYTKNATAYAPVKINTPISADNAGNLYFGYEVTGTVPANLSSLGTGGIAKVNATTGASVFKSVEAMNIDANLTRSSMNAAPAVTTDGSAIYVHLVGTMSGAPQPTYLVKLETKHLLPIAHVQVMDPSSPTHGVSVIDQSSASPMIGPDGHVFLGVFGYQWRESHGWMMQYDGDLNAADANGVAYPDGSFGWDDTAVVVPANIVPSYTGKASYLLLTKYNNYDEAELNVNDSGADGLNRVAILDPTSNNITKDRQTGIPVMNEIITVIGPTKTYADPLQPNAVNEWCINSAAVDIPRKSAIINSEDGHMYRWDFTTNTLTEAIDLTAATGEAYTETGIGPDGTLYVINNCILFALGTNKATSVNVVTGASPTGTLSNLWSVDGASYTVSSVSKSAGQTATVESNFTVIPANTNTLNVVVYATAASGVNGTVMAYNYKTKAYEALSATNVVSGVTTTTTSTFNFSASQTVFRFSANNNVADYIGPNGQLQLEVQAVGGTSAFKLSLDYLTCETN